jgi:plastocyanin
VQVRVVDGGGQNADAKLDLTVTAPPPPKGIDEPGTAAGGRIPENGSSEGAGDAGGGRPAEPPAAPDPPAAAAPAEPAPAESAPSAPAKPAKSTLSPIRMSAAPALVPPRALAVRAAAHGKTQPVADVHAAAASGVTIKDFKFLPGTTSVSVGDTITWTNQDVAPHTATANDGSFDTGSLSKGKSGSHTFTKAGSFPYICSIHPSMKGTVTVAAASGGGDTGSGAAATPDANSNTSGGLPQTGLDLLPVVLLASLMMGSGALLRRGVG